MQIGDERYYAMGNNGVYNWNKKLCWQAKDSLQDCIEGTENGNKYRCPDQLYAYEMWCPNDFRMINSMRRRKEKIDDVLYDKEFVDKINYQKQTIRPTQHHPSF